RHGWRDHSDGDRMDNPATSGTPFGRRCLQSARDARVERKACAWSDPVRHGLGRGRAMSWPRILKRRRGIHLAIVEPSADHYYQPGWTMVGARGAVIPLYPKGSIPALGVPEARDTQPDGET